MPSTGAIVGDWTLKEVINEGGNSVVWRGTSASGSEAAIKILKVPEGTERYARFQVEVDTNLEILRDVAGVLPLLAADVPDIAEGMSAPWLAMPVATALAEHLGERPAVEVAVDAVIQIARTLADLLEQYGISHRDIKPANLYWYHGGPAIGDFGLVAVPQGSGITRSDRDLGPRDFLAPEMRRGSGTREGPPADVFGLALTTFHLITGTAPRDGLRADEPSLLLAVLLDDPDLTELDRILQRASRYRAEDRITMAEFADELNAWRAPPMLSSGGFDASSFRQHFARVERRLHGNEPALDRNAALSPLLQRMDASARSTFALLQELGLQSSGAHARLFERLDVANRGIFTGSSLQLEPPGADGAVWIAAGLAVGGDGSDRGHVILGWVVAPYDDFPRTVWCRVPEVDIGSIRDLRMVDEYVNDWSSYAPVALERFAAEVDRFVEADIVRAPLPSAEPPSLESFTLRARSAHSVGAFHILGAAHIGESLVGVAGAAYNSSPSQARLSGPAGETVDLVFSADGNRVCGTRFDGFYEAQVRVEPFQPGDEWVVEYVMTVDAAGHRIGLSHESLLERGFDVRVVLPEP